MPDNAAEAWEAIIIGNILISLTKVSAIFAEVKEYFGFENNNQLFGYDVQIQPMCQSNSSCIKINNQGFLKSGCWSVSLCSLRNWNHFINNNLLKTLYTCCHRNCWPFEVRQQETWDCNCCIVLNVKQQEISWGCIVSRLFGGMQNACAYCLSSLCEPVL